MKFRSISQARPRSRPGMVQEWASWFRKRCRVASIEHCRAESRAKSEAPKTCVCEQRERRIQHMPDRPLMHYEGINILGNVATSDYLSSNTSPKSRDNAGEMNRGSAGEE